MGEILATGGRLLYLVCKQALRAQNVVYRVGESRAVLMWCDTVKIEYFHHMKPWQVINRFPWGRTMCRKAPFVRLIQRLEPYYPGLFSFLPKSYILPTENISFLTALNQKDRRYIYKPDKGSLGHGIKVIEKGESFPLRRRLAIAQEYIESYTIDDRKFDLRIYALVTSLEPLRIYIYRQGVARFCTASAEGKGRFSILTNTAVNQKNPDAELSKMTRMLTDVFAYLQTQGHDTAKLWDSIDNAIVLTIISAYGYLLKSQAKQCPDVGYPRCFQVFGCDVLLDKELNPYVLEINYRPSLKCNTTRSHELKYAMIQDALKLGCPYQPLQELLSNTEVLPETIEEYREFIKQHKDVLEDCESRRLENEIGNGFEKVFPNDKKPVWANVLETVKKLPADSTFDGNMPMQLRPPESPVLLTHHADIDCARSIRMGERDADSV